MHSRGSLWQNLPSHNLEPKLRATFSRAPCFPVTEQRFHPFPNVHPGMWHVELALETAGAEDEQGLTQRDGSLQQVSLLE